MAQSFTYMIMTWVALDVNTSILTQVLAPEPMKKWWLSKKRGRGERWANLIFDFIFQNKFLREEYFVCMTFYTYSPLDLCFTWMYTNVRKKEDLLTPY